MRLLKKTRHPDILTLDVPTIHRVATRAIVLKGSHILLLYTERYDDYSLPGGGVDEGEDLISGLKRELQEETGAQNIREINEFGVFEEHRPWYKPEHDIMFMQSYCFTCEIDDELSETNYEDYEIKNGMKALYMNIHEAIKHNEMVMDKSDKKGLSIERETILLNLIVKELL